MLVKICYAFILFDDGVRRSVAGHFRARHKSSPVAIYHSTRSSAPSSIKSSEANSLLRHLTAWPTAASFTRGFLDQRKPIHRCHPHKPPAANLVSVEQFAQIGFPVLLVVVGKSTSHRQIWTLESSSLVEHDTVPFRQPNGFRR
ncbi:hypothetical protein OPV22_030330 [Ensete ventricosum]|uniref:Uncharacterized protein n=1 Tax=Ensete ventricosum TaxID=4639 RepID=A0AAV8QDR4_ENSVE|nr:hypothetical protein OPV22_030330 [Ensete ventricosum]